MKKRIILSLFVMVISLLTLTGCGGLSEKNLIGTTWVYETDSPESIYEKYKEIIKFYEDGIVEREIWTKEDDRIGRGSRKIKNSYSVSDDYIIIEGSEQVKYKMKDNSFYNYAYPDYEYYKQ